MDINSLPKKVLDLFPKWSYQCPNCALEHNGVTMKCTQCGIKFDALKWRVPPKFLKNFETMSKYAHNVLAPKLKPKQRDLLFQYFTEFFNEGFESGDFSSWDYVGQSPTIISENIHHGSYAAEFDSFYEYVRKYINQGLVYARCYFRFNNLPASGENARFFCLGMSGGNPYCYCILQNNNGTIQIVFQVSGNQQVVDVEFEPDEWYCIEMKFEKNTDGSTKQKLWINGLKCCETTSVIVPYNIRSVDVGFFGAPWTNGSIVADCLIVADTYIGPEEEPPEPPSDAEANFEVCDVSEFDDTTTSQNETITITSDVVHHGSYSCKCDINTEGNAHAEGYFDISKQQPVFCRSYFKFNQLPETNKEYTIISFENTTDSTTIGYIQLIDDNGTKQWKMKFTGNPTYSTSTEKIPEINKWLCVEFAHGENLAKLWINGEEVLSNTVDVFNNTINRIHIGACKTDADTDDTLEINVDCVVVDNTYIGTETDIDNLFVNRRLHLLCDDAPQLQSLELINSIYGWTTTTLTDDADYDQNEVEVTNGTLFQANDWIIIRDDNNWEALEIESVSGDELTTKTNLKNSYLEQANASVDKWTPGGLTVPDNALRLGHQIDRQSSSIFLTKDAQTNAPLLTTDEGVLIKKDVSVGGYVGSNQGAIMLGHGLIHANDPPKISLMHSDIFFSSGYQLPDEPKPGEVFYYLTQEHNGNQPGYYFHNGESWESAEGEFLPFNAQQWQKFVLTKTEPHILYQYHDKWQNLGSIQNYEGGFDKLHIMRSNGTTLADVKCANVFADTLISEILEVNPESDNPVINLLQNTSERLFIGHNGTNSYISSRLGDLHLGSSDTGKEVICDVKLNTPSISINDIEIVTSNRILQNVTADASLITTGVFSTERVSFCNQNLNTTNDAIFNSVLGTSTIAGLKAGSGSNMVTITHDGSHGYVVSLSGALIIGSATGVLSFNTPTTIYPYGTNEGNIGTDTEYWGSVWTNYLRYKDIASFDALDDLELVKNYKTKKIELDGIETEIIDPESLSFLLAEKKDKHVEPFYDTGKVNGFLLGCVKRLTQELDHLKSKLSEKNEEK